MTKDQSTLPKGLTDEVIEALDAAYEQIQDLFYSGRYIPESDVKKTLRTINRAMLKAKGT